jgi:hypothetical protein
MRFLKLVRQFQHAHLCTGLVDRAESCCQCIMQFAVYVHRAAVRFKQQQHLQVARFGKAITQMHLNCSNSKGN